jgi:hypothetical protein
MELQLKHLAPYLPYQLKILDGWGDIKILDYSYLKNPHCKPILRPLSDLGKYIDSFQLIDSFDTVYCEITNTLKLFPHGGFNNVEWSFLIDNYILLQKLFELHFDVFELIEKGLAIDINTLNK